MTAGLMLAVTVQSLSAQSLTDALIAAYRNSPQLQSDRADLRASDEDVASTYSTRRPTVALSSSNKYTYTQVSSWTYAQSLTLSAELTLWDGGDNTLAHEAAKVMVDVGRETLRLAEQTVLLNAVTAFMDMRRDSQFMQLAENNYQVFGRQVQAAKDRYEVGEVRRTDVNLAEARLAGALSQIALRQGNLEYVREKFYVAIGEYPGQLQIPPPAPKIPVSLAAAKEIAMRNHPSIKTARHAAKITDINVARAEAAMKPTFTLSGSAALSTGTSAMATGNTASIGIAGLVPLYSGGALAAAKRKTIALQEQARSDIQLAGLSVGQAVTLAWSQIKSTRAAITARHKEVRASRVALRGITEEANLGARTTLDVLDAEQDLVSAESNLVAAKRDEYVAIYSLLSAMGLLNVNHLRLGIKTYDPQINYKKVSKAPPPTDRGKLLQKIFKRAGKQ